VNCIVPACHFIETAVAPLHGAFGGEADANLLRELEVVLGVGAVASGSGL
jgi:hypothetical protein